MSKDKNFLQRWSRRKQEAAHPAGERPELESTEATPIEKASLPPAESVPKQEAGVDLKSLPSIESITAATDIRPFLVPGVPEELRRAALRRAWQADPAIRDFVGLSENSWDFNNPEGVHGFGPLQMTEELKKLVERALAPRAEGGEEAATESRPETVGSTEPAARADGVPTIAEAAPASFIPPQTEEKNFAASAVPSPSGNHVASRREAAADRRNFHDSKVGRGGALPK